MKTAFALLGAAALFAAAPASAATCTFSLTGAVTEDGTTPDPVRGGFYSGAFIGKPLIAQFQSNCSPTPDIVDVPNQYFLLGSVAGVYDGPGIGGNNGQGTPPLLSGDIGFYPTTNGGGFSVNYPDDGSVNGGFGLFSLLGAQLYSGTLANPTFLPGTYAFTSDFYYGNVAAALQITQLDAVPEPATWAMLLVGVGLVGTALRTRKAKARVRFA